MSSELVKQDGGIVKAAKTNQNLSVFSNAESFNLAVRMADALAKSTIVPKTYQGNPANCMIAIEMASRINTSPMMVMQNLYIVNGTPAWSSQWIIAMINNSRRYKTELKFDIRYATDGSPISCMAWAEDYNGNKVTGPVITMDMARNEGWINKNGSKWKTMPEVMIRYRAASFFGRLNCPDMIMGIYSSDEVIDGFGDSLDDITGDGIENDGPVNSEDIRIITQDERQQFMQEIANRIEGKDDRNRAYLQILQELGIKTTTNMTVAQFNQAMDLARKIGSTEKTEAVEAENPD